jgi:hypothetical protein
MDIEQFKIDYNNNITQIELMGKYNLTDYMYKLILKNYQLSRKKSCKSLRLFKIKPNISKSFIPIDEIYKVDKQTPTEFYSIIKTPQEEAKNILPNAPKPTRNTRTKVVKLKTDIEKPVKKQIENKKQESKKIENKLPIKEPLKDEINDELKSLKNKIISRTDENIAKYKK